MHIDSLMQLLDMTFWTDIQVLQTSCLDSQHKLRTADQKTSYLLKEWPPHHLKPSIKYSDTSVAFILKQSHL